MKYSQYLQLREMLEQNGIAWEDFKKDPQLYEGILSNLGNKVLGFLGKTIKNLISKGISKEYINKLNDSADAIVEMVADSLQGKKSTDGEEGNNPEGIIKSIEKNVEKAKEIWIKKQGEDVDDELQNEFERKLENKKNNEITKYINGQVDIHSEKVKNSIKKKSSLSEEDKEDLLNYWEQLLTKIRVDVSGKLIEFGIIEDDDASNFFKRLAGVGRKRDGGVDAKKSGKKPKDPEGDKDVKGKAEVETTEEKKSEEVPAEKKTFMEKIVDGIINMK